MLVLENPRPHFGFNATAGSIRVALTAGMNEAPRAMSERIDATMTRVTVSDAVTPNSWLESTRPPAHAPTRPLPTPKEFFEPFGKVVKPRSPRRRG